ncbi:MAG TPA: hypothetical protein VGJ04_00685 [Pirellulales bacterium]
MRWIVAIALLLGATGWLACDFESPTLPAGNLLATTQWRHTVNGWERLITSPGGSQAGRVDLAECQLHPIVLSLLEGMLSVLMLAAFSSTASLLGTGIQPVREQEPEFGEIELHSRTWLTDPSGS